MAKEVKGKSGGSSKDKGKEKKLSAYEQEMAETSKKIKEFLVGCEANIASIFFKSPDLLYNYNLQIEDFSNNVWRVYYAIVKTLILVEKKQIIDDVTTGLFLEKHPQLKEKYNEYGGWETISAAMEYVKVENLESYIRDLRKWNLVKKLLKIGFAVAPRLSDYADMTSDEIYSELEVQLNHLCVNVDGNVKSYDITDGIYELIDKLDDGLSVGLPFDGLPMLNKETGGQNLGNITLVGGLSNVGKSTFLRNTLIPSILKNNEKLVILVNEDGIDRYQRETLVWVANNILKKDLQKYIVRDGKYSEDVKSILRQSADWLKENSQNHTISIVPFDSYSTDKAIKIIKKYSGMGVKFFALDTFKMDAGEVSDKSWLQLQQNMTKIYDAIKPETRNLHIFITFQLNKSSAKQRCYSQDNIGGGGKNILDCASTCIMLRNVMDDEYSGEKRAIQVFRLEGAQGRTKIPVTLDKKKKYQILFLIKNREGGTNYQIVIEHDMSRNIMREIGVTSIEVDY